MQMGLPGAAICSREGQLCRPGVRVGRVMDNNVAAAVSSAAA